VELLLHGFSVRLPTIYNTPFAKMQGGIWAKKPQKGRKFSLCFWLCGKKAARRPSAGAALPLSLLILYQLLPQI
jgi:hypothetical protein